MTSVLALSVRVLRLRPCDNACSMLLERLQADMLCTQYKINASSLKLRRRCSHVQSGARVQHKRVKYMQMEGHVQRQGHVQREEQRINLGLSTFTTCFRASHASLSADLHVESTPTFEDHTNKV